MPSVDCDEMNFCEIIPFPVCVNPYPVFKAGFILLILIKNYFVKVVLKYFHATTSIVEQQLSYWPM